MHSWENIYFFDTCQPQDTYKGSLFFLTYHLVFREASTTTKNRMVFDASMKTDWGKSLSLNDIFLVGFSYGLILW